MVKVKQLLEISLALPLRRVIHHRVCLLELAKLAEQHRQGTRDSPPVLDSLHQVRVLKVPLAAERSLGFRS
jgi:hypothetical protein